MKYRLWWERVNRRGPLGPDPSHALFMEKTTGLAPIPNASSILPWVPETLLPPLTLLRGAVVSPVAGRPYAKRRGRSASQGWAAPGEPSRCSEEAVRQQSHTAGGRPQATEGPANPDATRRRRQCLTASSRKKESHSLFQRSNRKPTQAQATSSILLTATVTTRTSCKLSMGQ